MTAPTSDALATARAALAAAELRTGLREGPGVERRARLRSIPGAAATPARPEPIGVRDLLPEGRLPQGSVSVVAGSPNLLLALLAASQERDDWIAFVAAPETGYLAAAERGIDLERVIAIPDTHGRPAETVAALLDGMSYVVTGPQIALSPSERRRLLVRARERGAGLVSTTPWEHAALRLHVVGARWSGVDEGAGYLRHCELDVDVAGRGAGLRQTIALPPGPVKGDDDRAAERKGDGGYEALAAFG
ncbi:hypothetical protein ACQFYA_20940 [Promicromonospora sp. Marseille-Q5078]